MAHSSAMDGWGEYNPCDHAIETPYYIGSLAIAAQNCTESCPFSTFPDNRQVCHPCSVVGCNTCSEQEGCKDCLIFHMPLPAGPGGRCLFLFGALFLAIALIAVSVCVFELLRFCCLGLLSPRNPQVLKEALAHRRRAKAHDYGVPGNPFYAYDETNVRRQSVSGLGPLLYFRFLAFQVLLALLLLLTIGLGHVLPMLSEGEARLLPELIPGEQLDTVLLAHAAALFLLAMLLVLWWAWQQGRLARQSVQEEPHLRNYALVAEGFPKSARSPQEVKVFFEAVLGFEVEGVSVAYDHAEELDFVHDRLSRAVERADTILGVYPAELSGLEGKAGESQDGYILDCLMCSGYAFVVFSREEDREFCLRRFTEIERQVAKGKSREAAEPEEEESLLQRPSGNPAVSRSVLFRGKFPIRMGPAPEPCGIQWQHFTLRRGSKILQAGCTLLGTAVFVAVVGAVALAPAVLYEMSYLDVEKPSKEQLRLAVLERTVAVASIVVGNRLLTASLRKAARGAGFLQRVNEDCDLLVSALLATLLAACVPILVADVVSWPSTTITRGLAVTWLFQVMWTDLFFTELSALVSMVWGYWSSYFWVRQNKYVSVRDAEPALVTGEFPFAERYADSLRSLSLAVAMLALDDRSYYAVGAVALQLLYCVYVFFFDKYTFLRVFRHTYYTSPRLDAAAQYMFAIPLATLALCPLQRIPLSIDPWIVAAATLGAALLFLALIRVVQGCLEPRREITEIPYIEVASLLPYNYFNTNPVHVLRSLHFPSIVVPPIYPFVSGKEYLQGGQFADYDDSVRLRETLMLLAKTPLKGLESMGSPQLAALGNPQELG